MEWRDIVIKSLFGALQAASAEFVVIQVVDQNTLYVAMAGALLRGGIEFLSELKRHFKAPVVASSSGRNKSSLGSCW